jgi:hypothetical protein
VVLPTLQLNEAMCRPSCRCRLGRSSAQMRSKHLSRLLVATSRAVRDAGNGVDHGDRATLRFFWWFLLFSKR